MKKKISLLMTLILLLCVFSGCGIFSIGQKVKEGIGTTEESTPSPSTESSKPTAEAAATPKPSEEKAEAELILDTEHTLIGSEAVYLIDSIGNFNLLYEKSKGETIEYAGGDGNRVYVLVSTYDDVKFKTHYMLYSINKDLENLETPIPYDYASAYYSTVYDECFYFRYYDDESNEKCVFYDPNGDAFVEEKDFSIVEEVLSNKDYRRMFGSVPPVYTVADVGKIYAIDEFGKIAIFDQNGGKVMDYTSPFDIGYYEYQGEGYFIGNYYETDDDYELVTDNHYIFNPEKDIAYCFDQRTNPDEISKEIFGVNDGYIYYGMNNLDDNHDVISRDFFRLKIDPNGAEAEKIGTAITDKHAPDYISGSESSGFKVIDGNAYYLSFNGTDLEWIKASSNGTSFETASVGVTDYHFAISDFGTISVITDSYKEGDQTYANYYVEDFKFNSNINNADSLNSVLSNKINGFVNNGKDTVNAVKNDEDNVKEWLSKYGDWYYYSAELSEIKELASHYLQVYYYDYMYMGGAHGMGSNYYIMLDTETGREVNIRDFYSKGEEAFKDLVATKSVEYVNNFNSDDYVFYDTIVEASDEGKYNEFYEYVSLDINIEFLEDGFNVVYPPYQFGPYASGDIKIFISYEDAGIDFK